MTRLESVLAQALALSEDDREILLIHVHESLPESKDPWADPAFIAELDRESKYADEHPESVLEWEDAKKEIFEGLLDR